MKIAIVLIVFLLTGSTVLAQQGAPAGTEAAKPAQALAGGGNEFAFDLYAKLSASGKGNLFFSPSSIHTALGMTYLGAAGATADQMAKTLHYPPGKDTLASALGELLKKLNTPGMTTVYSEPGGKAEQKPAYALSVSNALWPAKAYPFKASFIDLVKKEFGATLQEQDFLKDPGGSRKTINDAIAAQTQDKIKDLIPPGAITPDTRLVLTNAIYFKSSWQDHFIKEYTKDAPFHVSADKSVTCPMMNRQGHYGYFEGDGLQGLEMPYKNRDLSMFVLLPRKADGLAELEKKLSGAEVSKWLSGSRLAMVKVSFPRFKTTGQFSLAATLKAMGMTDAFSDRADFTAMSSAEKLFISDVVHKSFVAVDEEGTEAAAATAVMAVGMAARMPEEPKVFNADHPFVFLIRHNGTGAILFVGRLTAPGE